MRSPRAVVGVVASAPDRLRAAAFLVGMILLPLACVVAYGQASSEEKEAVAEEKLVDDEKLADERQSSGSNDVTDGGSAESEGDPPAASALSSDEAVEPLPGLPPAVDGTVDILCPIPSHSSVVGDVREYDTSFSRPPRAIDTPRPEYPAEAFAKKIEGTVKVEIVIGSDGHVLRARVIESVPGLDMAAARAACQWTFEPAVKDGRRVPTIARAPVYFSIGPSISDFGFPIFSREP